MPIQVNLSTDFGYVAEHTLFEGHRYRIGRSDNADVLVNHPQISRFHATLSANDDNLWTFEDTSSVGSYQRGKPIKTLAVNDQQILQLGPVKCLLKRLDHQQLTALDSQNMWRQQQLAQMTRQFSQRTDSTELLQSARHCLLQTLNCDRAVLILVDRQAQLQHCLGYPQWLNKADFSGSRTIISRCIEQRQALAIGDIQSDAELADARSVVQNNIQAALCVPIIHADSVVGVLYADNTHGRQFFTQTDVEFIQSFANFLALRLLFQSIEHNISLACNH